MKLEWTTKHDPNVGWVWQSTHPVKGFTITIGKLGAEYLVAGFGGVTALIAHDTIDNAKAFAEYLSDQVD